MRSRKNEFHIFIFIYTILSGEISMKNISKKRISKMIKSGFSNLNESDVKKLIDKEVKKGERADTDYIDLCFELLSLIENENESKRPAKRIKFSRAVAVAAVIIVIICAVGITAAAGSKDKIVFDSYVKTYSDRAEIDYQKKAKNESKVNLDCSDIEGSELYQFLKENNVKNILLPKKLYSMNYNSVGEGRENADFGIGLIFDGGIDVTINQVENKENLPDYRLKGEIKKSKKIKANGVDIYLFEVKSDAVENGVYTKISYLAGLTEYDISCPGMNIKEAEDFVKNIN